MLYFTWIDYHKETYKALFLDTFCAWQFGPVIPEVYYEYCAYGGRPINLKCETTICTEDMESLNRIIARYVDEPVNVMVQRTHQPGMPWDRTFQNGKGNRRVIPFHLIEELECGGQNVSRRDS
jgi:uncharacterized phage-associated protein